MYCCVCALWEVAASAPLSEQPDVSTVEEGHRFCKIGVTACVSQIDSLLLFEFGLNFNRHSRELLKAYVRCLLGPFD